MARIGLRLGITTLAVFALIGCGGGSNSIDISKATVRKRILAATRLANEAFAVAGLVRHDNRSVSSSKGFLPPRLSFVLLRQRDTPEGIDQATGLYYTLNITSNGSGVQKLYTDSGYHNAAGNFTWPAVVWSNGVLNKYPALLNVTFQITAGNFAGVHGTMDVTTKDATGNNDLMDITLTNAQGEKFVGHFQIINGIVSVAAQDILSDGTSCQVVDDTNSNGDIVCDTTFPDGSQATIDANPDGGGDQTYTDNSGLTDATGDFNSDGSDTVTYDDGSDETVDVDTSDE
jgi:hypothetical protein